MTNRDLADLARHLREAEQRLPNRADLGSSECDDWCKLWMLLVGAWYSLHYPRPFLQKEKLRLVLKAAHKTAINHLAQPRPLPVPPVAGANPWFAGYYLISAEHRLADVLDRATKLTLRDLALADCTVRARREALRVGCPRCSHTYPPELRTALDSSGPLVRVYERVNAIKHDAPEEDIDALSTEQRWNDAFDALRAGANVTAAFGDHDARCANRKGRGV